MPQAGVYGLNQVYNRGGWSHSFVSLVFPKLKVNRNNNRSTRLQPGFIKGGHIICHILQYNRPIIGGDRLVFLHVPPKLYGGYAHASSEHKLIIFDEIRELSDPP